MLEFGIKVENKEKMIGALVSNCKTDFAKNLVSVGSRLLAINGQRVNHLPFQKIVSLLTTTNHTKASKDYRPLILLFSEACLAHFSKC